MGSDLFHDEVTQELTFEDFRMHRFRHRTLALTQLLRQDFDRIITIASEGIAKGAIEAFSRNGIEVGRDVFVVAIGREGRMFDSFLSRVQTNYRHLAELAVSEAMPRLIPTAPGRPVPAAAGRCRAKPAGQPPRLRWASRLPACLASPR